LPAKTPDLFFAHNLAAARRFWFVRELHPGIPYVFYYHGGEVPGVPSIDDEAARRAFSSPDIVFTNTQFSRLDAIKRNCPAEKLCILPVGFRISDYKPKIGRSYKADGKLRLLTIGRASPEKGFPIALEAIRQLVHERGVKDFHYVIVGDGPDLPKTRRLVEELKLGEYVTLFGWATREQLTEEINKADVFILPSLEINNWSENQACVTQEAMLMRVPVIASTIGGVRESIAPELRDWMFEPGNSRQLADRLVEIAKRDPAYLEDLGNRGREFAEKGYDVATLNFRLLKLGIARTPVSDASVVSTSG
jgi:glycosyltransferase involved in cell wall biosynthesis